MAREIWIYKDGVLDSQNTITDPTDFDFDFESAPLDSVTFEAGVEISARLLSNETAPFTVAAVTVDTQPQFLDQVVEGYSVEIQPATFSGTPNPQVTQSLDLNGSAVTLPSDNVYDVPSGTAGQTLEYSESASNNVVDGLGNPILQTPSITETVIAASAPTVATVGEIQNSPEEGRTVALVLATFNGAPDPTRTFTLELNSVDVTADVSGLEYDIPAGTAGGTLTLTTTGTNGEGSLDDVASVTVTVQSIDADAQAYINRVETADGQALESAVVSAVNDFFIAIKNAGVYAKRSQILLLAGPRTLAGMLEPAKGVDPTSNNFVASDYLRATGIKGNASTKWLATNTTEVSNTDVAYSVVPTEVISGGDNVYFSSESNSRQVLVRSDGFIRPQNGSGFSYGALGSDGDYISLVRDNSSNAEITLNTTHKNIPLAAAGQSTENMRILRQHGDGGYGNHRIAYWSQGVFLTQAERANEKAAIDQFLADIGAALP